MHLPEGQQPTIPPVIRHRQHPDSHYQPLKDAIPHWLANASPTRRQALGNTRPQLAARLQAALAAEHQALKALKALNAAHWTAQSEVDKQLEHLQDASAFAEPLLKAALKRRFGLEVDVKTTFLRLYVPSTTPWFPVKIGARAWTVSLLDAALHNFEEKETQGSAYETDSTYVTQPSVTGQFDTLPLIKARMSIPAFTKLCRELDIGRQYASYLEDNLGFSNPVAASQLRNKVDASQKNAIKAALQWARMNNDIGASYFRLIGGLLDGLQGIRLNGYPVVCHDLTMLSAPLTGIVVFAPDLDQARATAPVVAYVPDDPQHPIKEYASPLEMVIELTRRLRSKDYQQFFSRFVNHGHRGFFFASLNDRLSKVKWHPPIAGSSEPTWRETPTDRPNLQTAFVPFNDNLWQHLYQTKLNRILNDARVIAVPTATVDQKTRWAFWDSLINLASSIVQTAALVIAPFVPVLGEVMMAYMAYQLLDEAFEGIVEWAQGQTTEAFEHFMGTIESLVQLGAFAIGGAIGAGEYRNVLPKEIIAFIDRFKRVELPNGQTRYWEPDLARYEQKSIPGAGSTPNTRGLHQHQGKQLLPLEDAHFAVTESAIPGQYHIEHPTRPDAYQPLVRHNSDGAWHTELEQPLAWDKPTVLRRIGPSVESFTPAQREIILQVSGYNENALRKMHVNQEPLPPLLADTIKRFTIDQDLKRFVDLIDSDLPEDYLSADPLVQLQLLHESGRWPTGKRMRLLDQQGNVIWQSSIDERLLPTTIRQDRLIDGDLLKTLLHSLDEREAQTLLGEEFGGPMLTQELRARALRKHLAQFAWQQRTAMFEFRYQALERIDDPLAQTIIQHDPQLPVSVTRELLDTATGDELLQISEGQLPERQQELIQLANQEVRLSRAFEGLELDTVSNPDTDTLALHSLKRLPGWSGDVRIEIRDGRYEGPMLDSTGRPDAPYQKVLVRQPDGTFQPFDNRGQELHSATDFYSSVLYALPDAERQAVGVQIGQGGRLKQAIRERPMERSELRLAISIPPIEEPPIDTLRLDGRDGYGQTPRPEAGEVPVFFDVNLPDQRDRIITPAERVQAIYRGYTAEEAQAFIASVQDHPTGLNGELSRLRNEYTRLSDDLRRWQINVPATDPANGVRLTETQRRAAVQNRSALRDAILRCWQRQTRGPAGFMLQVVEPILGDLPTLGADFSHVTALTINGSASTRAVDTFFQHFPNLLSMEVHDVHLPTLPPSLSTMPLLRQLIVRNCGVTLSPANQSTLSSLPQLSMLNLNGNPLRRAPDIHRMPWLRYLDLTNTEISTPPAGLLDHPQLVTGVFDDNQITEIPVALFSLTNMLSDGFSFAKNPLTETTRNLAKIHYQRTGKHFGVVPELADITRATDLFPSLNPAQATDLLYRLPGTLEQGRVQLTHWEAELTQMKDELKRWTNSVPDRDPATGVRLNIQEQTSEAISRETFAGTVEEFWRSRSSRRPDIRETQFVATLEFKGDMPPLSADLSHVSKLSLTGNKSISAISPFLQCFPKLNILELRFFDLESTLESVVNMPGLSALELKDCSVVLTPEIQAALCSMNNLQTLELSDNPLGTFFDLNLLPKLAYIDLSNTRLTEIPAGLSIHPKLRSAIFNDNFISNIPEDIFAFPAHRGTSFEFTDNPLLPVTRERIKTYFRETGINFNVRAEFVDIELTQDLFPSLSSLEASDVIYGLPGTLADGVIQLRQWKTELDTLTADLTAWSLDIPSQHSATGEGLSAIELRDEANSRSAFAKNLQRLWRRRSSHGRRAKHFALDLAFTGDMPRLTADFSHVSSLQLVGNTAIGSIEPFLDIFPQVKVLEMRDFALNRIPQPVTRMPNLKEITLANCDLTLTAEDQATLSSMGKLELLKLSDNPLVTAPDLLLMHALNDLQLVNCGITHLPNGIADHPNLRSALLSGNQITELPEAFFNLDLDLADGIDLSINPLSPESRDRIKTYYARNERNFRVLAEPGDIERTRALFTHLNIEEASHLVYQLPGTLEAGRAELARWEGEIVRMTSDLEAWAQQVPDRHPSTGSFLDGADRTIQRILKKEFSRKLEQFWRESRAAGSEIEGKTFVADLAFIGDMPTLTADFSDVLQLSLQGHDALNVSDTFLTCFNGLRKLEMHGFGLGRFPQAVTRMPSLQTLILNSCDVVFDDQAQAALFPLSRLTTLDLYNNKLGTAPNVSPLRKLKVLDLSRTGIDRVPEGLWTLPLLETALLSENAIIELPDVLPTFSGRATDLSHNPLSTTSLERIKIYYQKTGSHLGVLADLADIDLTQTLYPHLSDAEASDFVYTLPGTLVDGRLELARRHTEIATLISDLEAWTNEIPISRVTHAPLQAEALLQEKFLRTQFKKNLEQCWRQVRTGDFAEYRLPYNSFTLDLSFIGDPPVLSADFGHVRGLTLTSTTDAPPQVDSFLGHFPNLGFLEIRDYRLDSLPTAVLGMNKLEELNLPNCHITLTRQSVNALGTMENLRTLNLRNNPLGLTPDLSKMKRCRTLDLSDTGLTAIPEDLFNNNHLTRVNLSNNAITEVPEALFNLTHLDFVDLSNNAITEIPLHLLSTPHDYIVDFKFTGNSLSATSQQRLASYVELRSKRLVERSTLENQRWKEFQQWDDSSSD